MKITKKRGLFLGLLLLLLVGVCVPVSAAGSTNAAKSGLTKVGSRYRYYSKGKPIKSKWKTIGKNRYYFNYKGYAATDSLKISGSVYVFDKTGKLVRPSKTGLKTVGKYTYILDTKGRAATGWKTLGKKLYFADSKGRIYKSKTYQGVTFTKAGYAKSSTASNLKKKTMSIVASITKPGMSKSQKLNACWNYVTSHSRFYYSSIYYPNLNKKGWQRDTAWNTLVYGRGNCYGFACAFAALAKEVGYDPYVICGRVSGNRDGASDNMTRHCWVRINGAYYDPEAQFAGWYKGVYGNGSYDIAHTVSSITRFAG